MQIYEETQNQEAATNEGETQWTAVALQACLTTVSALLGGFAAAAGAHAFSKLVNRQPNLSDLGNVVELKSKLG